MNPITVPTSGRLGVTYSFHEALEPVSDRVVALHHGICHSRDQFLPLIMQLNGMGIHAAAIDQQSEGAGLFRNCIGLKQYREGMAAAVKRFESDHSPLRVGSYALHSMGALIGEEMQQRHRGLRRPTVLMAPVPVDGALPITLRILRRHPLSYLKAVLTLNIRSLARTPEQVRELFFDDRTHEPIVKDTAAQLKHASFWVYCQLVLRWMVRPRIHNDRLPKLLLVSATDEIFHPPEYEKTRDRYPQLELDWIDGGHDFFIQYADVTAQRIAAFHMRHEAEVIAEPRAHPHFLR
jgi:pimeloyl-ACP methyl ester carboxylesterase